MKNRFFRSYTSKIASLTRVSFSLIEILFATSGIFIRRVTGVRALVSATCALLLIWSALNTELPRSFVLVGFIGVFLVRYVFLFSSFVPRGIADCLILRFGFTRGFDVYEALTGLQFCLRAVTFAWLLQATQVPFLDPWRQILTICGVVLIGTGTIVNVWSTYVIGIPSYYYGDLFVQDLQAEANFKSAGPYRFLRNPMYGVGQAAGYGAALVAGSFGGILATALNQLMMYVFNAYIEAPHVRKMLLRRTTSGDTIATNLQSRGQEGSF